MGEKYLHVNFWSSYILFLPPKNHFWNVGRFQTPLGSPNFAEHGSYGALLLHAWLLCGFEKKSSLHIEFGSFFSFCLTPCFFFCVIWPIFGYPKPNMKWFLSHLQPATEFHNLAVEWAQNWPLLMSLEAICNFFPLQRGQKSVFWGFLVFFKAIA